MEISFYKITMYPVPTYDPLMFINYLHHHHFFTYFFTSFFLLYTYS